jgi:hypothetical protein
MKFPTPDQFLNSFLVGNLVVAAGSFLLAVFAIAFILAGISFEAVTSGTTTTHDTVSETRTALRECLDIPHHSAQVTVIWSAPVNGAKFPKQWEVRCRRIQ